MKRLAVTAFLALLASGCATPTARTAAGDAAMVEVDKEGLGDACRQNDAFAPNAP